MRKHFGQEKQHFSIRKYTFGAASVLVGASIIFGSHAQADDQVVADTKTSSDVDQVVAASLESSEVEEQAQADDGAEVKTETNLSSEGTSQAVKEETVQADTSSTGTESTSASTATDSSEQVDVPQESGQAVTTETVAGALVASDEKQSDQQVESSQSSATGGATFFSAPVAKERSASEEAGIPETGNYTYQSRTEVKNDPVISAPTQFYANAGDRIFYDRLIKNDGYVWISYTSYSGVRRYAAIKELEKKTPAANKQTAPQSPITGKITFKNQTSNGFDVIIKEASDSKGIKSVQVPVWSEKSGQDDLIWYEAAKQSDGTYKTSVDIAKHKNDRGTYNVHLYYVDGSNQMVGVATAQTTVAEPNTNAKNLPATGYYTFDKEVEVKSEPKMSAKTDFTFEKNRRIFYNQVLEADNHQWISYVSYSGQRRYIPIVELKATTTTPAKANDVVAGKLAIKNQTSEGFDVIVSNVSATKGVKGVSIPVWSTKNDQDDIVWYRGQAQSDGTYKTHVSVRDHKNDYGDYAVHLYYTLGDNSFQGVATTTTHVDAPKNEVSGKLTITNKNTDGFDVVVSNVSATKGVKDVRIPVWSTKNDQDDIVWYRGQAQSDGTYKTHVSVRDHKNDYGDYAVHLYYTLGDNSFRGVATTMTHVEAPKDEVSGKITVTNQNSEGFDVVVSNVSATKGVKDARIPVWSTKNDQDDIVWYQAAKQTDGTYKTHVSVRDHKNDYGDYAVHLYYTLGDNSFRGVAATMTHLDTPKDEATGKISVTNKTVEGFDVVISNVSSTRGVKGVSIPVWTSKNNQDDIVWYTGQAQSDGTYKAHVSVRDHKNEYGTYNIHLYYTGNDNSFRGVAATAVTLEAPKDEATGKISVTNKTAEGFDVVISQAASTRGIKSVSIPVWSVENGQDDIVWYTGQAQSDGTYKAHVVVRDHKNNYGDYDIHLYYTGNDNSFRGVATAQTHLDAPARGQLSYNGSYYHIQGKYDDILIVNKKHPLSSNYNPGENATAKEAFTRLRNDMINQGYNVGYSYSGFRSYNTQVGLYNNYVSRDGQAQADRYSARPGYSEHQTGLAFDLTDKAGNLLEDTAAANWLKDHAHDYGFIVRYQPGKEASTGFMQEAWHVRYIGREAREVHDSGLSLEEYFGVDGGGYGAASQPSSNSSQAVNIPTQGSYTFTHRVAIKAEPKQSSQEIAYYDAGNRVNYDRVLNEDGKTWISYVAFSGARRYIAIN